MVLTLCQMKFIVLPDNYQTQPDTWATTLFKCLFWLQYEPKLFRTDLRCQMPFKRSHEPAMLCEHTTSLAWFCSCNHRLVLTHWARNAAWSYWIHATGSFASLNAGKSRPFTSKRSAMIGPRASLRALVVNRVCKNGSDWSTWMKKHNGCATSCSFWCRVVVVHFSAEVNIKNKYLIFVFIFTRSNEHAPGRSSYSFFQRQYFICLNIQ